MKTQFPPRRFIPVLAAATTVGVLSPALNAQAGSPDVFGPQGSTQTPSAIPGNVAPRPSRLVTDRLNGSSHTWVAVDVAPNGIPGCPRHGDVALEEPLHRACRIGGPALRRPRA